MSAPTELPSPMAGPSDATGRPRLLLQQADHLSDDPSIRARAAADAAARVLPLHGPKHPESLALLADADRAATDAYEVGYPVWRVRPPLCRREHPEHEHLHLTN